MFSPMQTGKSYYVIRIFLEGEMTLKLKILFVHHILPLLKVFFLLNVIWMKIKFTSFLLIIPVATWGKNVVFLNLWIL